VSSQSIATSRRAAYAASAEDREVRASTLPRVRRLDDGSPGASTPSLADSAVGSSAEGLVGSAGVQVSGSLVPAKEVARPRSDGSDSLATSSTVASPEPTEQRQQVATTTDDSAETSQSRVSEVVEKNVEGVAKEYSQKGLFSMRGDFSYS
jgi:hypothetical protein